MYQLDSSKIFILVEESRNNEQQALSLMLYIIVQAHESQLTSGFPSKKKKIFHAWCYDGGTYQNIPDSIKLLITLTYYPILKDDRNVWILNI